MFNGIYSLIQEFKKEIETFVKNLDFSVSRKEFASSICCVDGIIKNYLFKLYDKKEIDLNEYVNSIHIDKLIKYCEK